MSDWLDFLRALAVGVGFAIPIGALMISFHRERITRFDIGDAAHVRMEQAISRLDMDLTGLAQQLAAMAAEHERRFVPRAEFTASIDGINGRLFNLAQEHRTRRGT